MGNRAVITTSPFGKENVGVYLHWNGGKDSVEAFLKYCELYKHRPPSVDCYGWARLCQVIGNFFGDTTSIGVDKCSRLDCDNKDNGTYLIDGWKIVGRKYHEGVVEQENYKLKEMLEEINALQPKHCQIDQLITEYQKCVEEEAEEKQK